MVEVRIVRLHQDSKIPTCAKAGDAGVDLYAYKSALIKKNLGRQVVPTGIAIELPEGYAGFVQPRSGLAARYGVTCLNSPGLIDSSYRGEIKVILINLDPFHDYMVHKGDRIAQLVIKAVEKVEFIEVDQLSKSDRGILGFGHSGR